MWYLTIHRWTGNAQKAIDRCVDDHLAWMREQQLAGRILMAGPSPDGELGVFVFGHMPRQEVDDILRDEPFVAAGYRRYEVIPWDVHHVLGIGGFDRNAIAAMFNYGPAVQDLPGSRTSVSTKGTS